MHISGLLIAIGLLHRAVSERTRSISFCLVSFCSRRFGLSGRMCGAWKGLVLSMDGREAAILARRSLCSFWQRS